MINKEFKNLDISLFFERLDNGLEIYLIPFENRNNYYVDYCVKYGSNDNIFISNKTNKQIKMPYGIAHFLEHKMFEQEDGVDPFSYYSESGTDSNASTSYDITSYTLDGTKNIEENLEFLLNFVNSPYFTKKNVEKEKGIIIEELNMYKDQPENSLYVESNKAIFHRHPMRVDIGGTPSSVKRITKEMLEECYNTFYQPSNMFLVISGSFDKDKVIKTIKNNKILNSRELVGKPVVVRPIEPFMVNTKEKIIKITNLVLSKFILSFKYSIDEMKNIETYKYMLELDILLYILFGISSDFREEILKDEMSSLFYSSADKIDNIIIVEFIAETNKPYELKEKILTFLKDKKISNEDVERVKKVRISLEVMDSDNPSKLMNSVISNIINYNEVIYNKIEIIRSITLEDILKVRKDIILDNYSFILGKTK